MALLYRIGTGNGSGGDLKPYIVQFTCDSGYIGQTLTMTYKSTPHAGETVDNVSGTVASDGTLTLYPMHSGNWECSCYSSVTGTTMKKTIELSYWGTTNVEFNDIPDGATVTPTDDVQTWLHCANIWDKTDLTTINGVIADTTTLNILISDNNASDYLARSTTWVSDVCNNESAMTYIGNNNYCANKLLANSTWCNAICNSTYFEKVLNVKVPTMTSATNPYGRVESSHDESATYAGWKAFDGNDSTLWSYGNVSVGSTEWISYEFVNTICPKKAFVKFAFINRISDIKIEGYNGTTWELLANVTTNNDYTIFNDNKNYYKKLRLSCKDIGSGTPNLNTLQFYGREEA